MKQLTEEKATWRIRISNNLISMLAIPLSQ